MIMSVPLLAVTGVPGDDGTGATILELEINIERSLDTSDKP
jgi:hypothetical protein